MMQNIDKSNEQAIADHKTAKLLIGLEEFCFRFKARMLSRAGLTFADGDSVADYADQAAPAYFEDESMRADGPEECADCDVSYWED